MAPNMKNNLGYHYETNCAFVFHVYTRIKVAIVRVGRVVDHHRRYIYNHTTLHTQSPSYLIWHLLPKNPPCYSEICMGADEELNETRDNGVSRYLYGKIIQETHLSRYSADLVTTGLVIARFYSMLVYGRQCDGHHSVSRGITSLRIIVQSCTP